MIARIVIQSMILLVALPTVVYPKPQHYYATASPTPQLTPEPGPSRQQLFDTVDHIVRLSQDLQKNLDNERAAHKTTDGQLDDAKTQNATLQKRIDKQTNDFNALKDSYASQNKKLWWYRIHFFLGWALFISGILAVGFLAFLKFTGKLALFGASVAAKVP